MHTTYQYPKLCVMLLPDSHDCPVDSSTICALLLEELNKHGKLLHLGPRTFHHCHRNFNLGQRLGVVTSGLHCEIAFSARRITYTLPLFLLDSSPSLSAAAPTFAMYPVFESAFFKVSRLITQSPLLSDTLVNDTSR